MNNVWKKDVLKLLISNMNLNALPYAVRRYLRSVDKHSGEYVQLKPRIEWTELLPRQQNEGNNRGEEIGV